MQKIMDKFLAFSDKLSSIKWFQALSRASMASLPAIVIGSFFNIIASLPSILTFLPQWSEATYNFLYAPYTISFGIIGLIVTFAMGYYYAEMKNVNALFAGIISVMIFVFVALDPVDAENSVYNIANLGSQGMFTGIIVAIIFVNLSALFDKYNIKIKFPDSVPSFVSGPFNQLFSGAVGFLVVHLINTLLINATGGGLTSILTIILAPLFKASDSLAFMIIFATWGSICWFFGVHGLAIIAGIVMPMLIGNAMANGGAAAAGQPLPFIFTITTMQWMAASKWVQPWIMMFTAKSERLKAVAKVGAVPNFFNITEPMEFGIPMVGNLIMTIASIIVGTINSIIMWVSISSGFVPRPANILPMGFPDPFVGFLGTGSWKAFIVDLLMIGVQVLVWVPAMLAYDRRLVKQEQEASKTE